MDMRKGLAPPQSFSFFNARPSVKTCLKSKNNLLRKLCFLTNAYL